VRFSGSIKCFNDSSIFTPFVFTDSFLSYVDAARWLLKYVWCTSQPAKDFPWICFNMLLVGNREGEREAQLLVSAESDTTQTGRHFGRRSIYMYVWDLYMVTFGYEHKFHRLYFAIFFSRLLLGFAHIFNAWRIWWANGIWQHWCKFFKMRMWPYLCRGYDVWCSVKIDIWEVGSRCLLIWTLYYVRLCAVHWQNCMHKQKDNKWRTGLMCAS